MVGARKGEGEGEQNGNNEEPGIIADEGGVKGCLPGVASLMKREKETVTGVSKRPPGGERKEEAGKKKGPRLTSHVIGRQKKLD